MLCLQVNTLNLLERCIRKQTGENHFRLRELSQKLTFVDFLEALARFADLFSPLPRVSVR